MSTIKIQNDKGRSFTVKIVRKGETYGLNNRLTHDEDDALVEFYDATRTGFGPEGQFVSRYYASTLLGEDTFSSRIRGQGICLQGDEPAWSIDGAAMEVVEAFTESNRRGDA